MCLLIVKPAGLSVDTDCLYNAALAHPHGAGIAWSNGSRVSIEKDHAPDIDDLVARLETLQEFPALVHFRYATHGSVSVDNTHPFELPNGWAAAHNGVFHNVKPVGDESDTRAFLRSYVAPLVERDALAAGLPLLEQLALGNRLAVLSPDGKATIVGERLGLWRCGVWYSNDSAFDCWADEFDDDEAELGIVEDAETPWYYDDAPKCDNCRFPLIENEDRICSFCRDELLYRRR